MRANSYFYRSYRWKTGMGVGAFWPPSWVGSRCLGWLSLLNCIRPLALSLLLKLPPVKLEPWFVIWNFFLLRLPCIPINLPYGCLWNIVVMSVLVFVVATWNCWISCRNEYAGLLVLHLLAVLNHWLIIEM